MIPLWRPLIGATVAVVVALPVDHRTGVLPRRGLVRWPVLALATVVGAYLVFAIPMLAVVATTSALAAAWARSHAPPESAPRVARPPVAAFALTSALFLAVTLLDRASTPCFWDAFVWLAKARYAAGGLEALIVGGLHTTLPPFIPSGYPLLEPLAVAMLAGFSSRPEAVVAGAIGLEVLATLLFVAAIADDDRVSPRDRTVRLATVSVVLLASPLVLVHLRSAYVDLPLGLLVATVAILLRRDGAGVACAIVAIAAAAMKDEGMVHVGAITLFGVLRGFTGKRDEPLVRRSIACGLTAAVVMAGWHLRLRLNEIANTDHAIAFPDGHRVAPLAKAALDHLLELRSWGALGVLGTGATLAVFVRPRSAPKDALWFASLLALDVVVLFAALLATPGRVMEFATEGTLLNRLGMQLAPLAAVVVASWVGARAIADREALTPPTPSPDKVGRGGARASSSPLARASRERGRG